MKKVTALLFALAAIMLQTSCEKSELPFLMPNKPNGYVPPKENGHGLSQDPDRSFGSDTLFLDRSTPNGFNGGCDLMPRDQYDRLDKFPDADANEQLPTSYTLPCPPVLSQGGEGSCVAWGTVYSARSISWRIRYNQKSYSYSANLFSPEYIFNQIKNDATNCYGAYVPNAMNLLMTQGVCRWSVMPYSSTNGCSLQPGTVERNDASYYRITSWGTVTRSVANFKNYLQSKKPIIVAGPVDATYCSLGYNQVITSYNSATWRGNHCYTVVGWDDRMQAFLVMNSWGTGWGTNGFGYISYNLMSTLFTEAYVLNG
ncbi:MAG: hypothetical protein RL021_1815 [Bacteroidota bacterium]|jgi:hypothetical protein